MYHTGQMLVMDGPGCLEQGRDGGSVYTERGEVNDIDQHVSIYL